jgi:RmlD substrate binding domain
MKIVVVGATGVVGKAVVAGLNPRHEIVQVGKTRGEHQVDIKDRASIAALFKRIGKFDAWSRRWARCISASSPVAGNFGDHQSVSGMTRRCPSR